MNKVIIFLLIITSTSLFANQSRYARRIMRLARDVHQLSIYGADDLDPREQRVLIRQLRKSKRILLGSTDRNITCSKQGRLHYQEAITTLKHMAMSSTGLELTEENAISFARHWATKFRCELARRYARDTRDIRVFSGAATGLNLSDKDSINFSKEMTQKFCGDRRFRNDFYDTFSFAHSASGLNLPLEQARTYARNQLISDHFSCSYGEFNFQ